MSDTVKKKWSKKKKILVIVFSIIFSLLVLAVIGGVIGLNMYCKAPEYTVTQISDSYKDKVQLIAHRGFRAVAPENTIPAYEEQEKLVSGVLKTMYTEHQMAYGLFTMIQLLTE